MKKLPDLFRNSRYKYNIITRLILLQGNESNFRDKKLELIHYLKEHGAKEGTIRRWLIIERGVKQEIPTSALVVVKDFLNEKYRQMHVPSSLNEGDCFEQIDVEDLYYEGQLKIIPNP